MKAVVGSVAQEYQEGYSIQQNIHTVYMYGTSFTYCFQQELRVYGQTVVMQVVMSPKIRANLFFDVDKRFDTIDTLHSPFWRYYIVRTKPTSSLLCDKLPHLSLLIVKV